MLTLSETLACLDAHKVYDKLSEIEQALCGWKTLHYSTHFSRAFSLSVQHLSAGRGSCTKGGLLYTSRCERQTHSPVSFAGSHAVQVIGGSIGACLQESCGEKRKNFSLVTQLKRINWLARSPKRHFCHKRVSASNCSALNPLPFCLSFAPFGFTAGETSYCGAMKLLPCTMLWAQNNNQTCRGYGPRPHGQDKLLNTMCHSRLQGEKKGKLSQAENNTPVTLRQCHC